MSSITQSNELTAALNPAASAQLAGQYSGRMNVAGKLNYGIGDFGNNIIWQMLSIWLAVFYTEVYGLPAIEVGTLYLVMRVFDAVTDPLVGYWVDRTRTRFGSCRPFILLGTLPLALSFIMVFYTPDLGESGKRLYAYGSFALLSLTYTLVNVPYSAMAGFLTRDSDERTTLQSYRFGLGMFAGVLISFLVIPLVEMLGQGDEQQGYFFTSVVFAIVIVISLFYCALSIKERYPPPPLSSQSGGVGALLSDLREALRNRQLVILYSANLIFFITLTMKGTTAVYYINEVLENAADRVSLFLTMGSIGAALGAAFSSYLWTRFDKVRAYKALMLVCFILSAIPYWMPGNWFVTIMLLGVVVSFISISMVPLTWSMLSDLVDYQKTLTGRDMAGLFFALFLFTLKVALGVGGAIALWIIGTTGYDAALEQQTAEVAQSINFVGTLLPGLLFFSAAIVMNFYALDRNFRQQIKQQLYGHMATDATEGKLPQA